MMTRDKFEAQLETKAEARQARIMKTFEKHADALDRAERRFASRVGQLCRDGRTVHYAFTSSGKYIEAQHDFQVTALLFKYEG